MLSGKTETSLSLAFALALTLICSNITQVVANERADLAASAKDIEPLEAGDRAPRFVVRTVDDEAFTFDPDNLERPTVLVSFRGGWCPYCNLHLSELRHVVPQLNDEGYQVLFLSGDAPAQLYSSLQKETQEDIEGLGYTILSDASVAAARAFGTAFRTDEGLNDYLDGKNFDYAEGSIGRHGALSVPYVYVVDTDGRIVFDFVEPDYKVRLPADELLAAARKAQ